MRAMILAAGYGERLKPFTDRLPKPLFPLAGVSILENSIRYLARQDFRNIIVNVHHLAPQVISELESIDLSGVKIAISKEDPILGTGGGIKAAEPFLSDGEPFLVMNSDVVTDLDLEPILRFHHDKQAAGTMVLRDDPEKESFGTIRLGDGEVVCSIPPHDPEVKREWKEEWMFTGIQIFSPDVFSYLPNGMYTDIMKILYPPLVQEGKRVMGWVTQAGWREIGTPGRYLKTVSDILNGRIRNEFLDLIQHEGIYRSPSSSVDSSVRLIPPVFIDRSAKVGPHSVLGPETLVGPHATVGSDCKVERSTVLPHSVLEEKTVLRDGIG